MQQYLEQARHNKELHDALVEQFPDKYFDWKTTLLFYVAIHYVKALAAMLKRNIGESHAEINRNIKQNPRGPVAVMPLSQTAYTYYFELFEYSRAARYTGILDVANFETLKKKDYLVALETFEDFEQYMKNTRHLPI